MAVCDAKTANDLDNLHTQMQLRAMLQLRDRAGRRLRIFLAFPRSAIVEASRVILRLGLKDALRVSLVPVPDAMLLERIP